MLDPVRDLNTPIERTGNTCAIGVIPEDKLVQNTKPIISMFAYLSPFFSPNTL